MATVKLGRFFTQRRFRVPAYQRTYTWELRHVDDFLNDLRDASDSLLLSREKKYDHYLGAFVLCEPVIDSLNLDVIESCELLDVVDGQQRLITTLMTIGVIVRRLESIDPQRAQAERINYLYELGDVSREGRCRLLLDADLQEQFECALNGKARPPVSTGQRHISEAAGRLSSVIGQLTVDELKRWMLAISNFEVLEHINSTEDQAVRIFQTVNDRGKKLSNIEKLKSFLFYQSVRHLHGSKNGLIATSFGEIFRSFDLIKEYAALHGYEIPMMCLDGFTEDEILRYHFQSFKSSVWNDKGANYFENIKMLFFQVAKDSSALDQLMQRFLQDLVQFFDAFCRIVSRVSSNANYFKAFKILKMRSAMFPLLVRLECGGVLDQELQSNCGRTIFDLVQSLELRRRVLGGDDERKLASLAVSCSELEVAKSPIEDCIRTHGKQELSDDLFRYSLKFRVDSRNSALKLIFSEYSEFLTGNRWTLEELMALEQTNPQVEHVHSKEPPFAFPGQGFASRETYLLAIERLGNLVALEEKLNSRCSNLMPHQKATQQNCYPESSYESVRRLASGILHSGSWTYDDIERRTNEIADFCTQRWYF